MTNNKTVEKVVVCVAKGGGYFNNVCTIKKKIICPQLYYYV